MGNFYIHLAIFFSGHTGGDDDEDGKLRLGERKKRNFFYKKENILKWNSILVFAESFSEMGQSGPLFFVYFHSFHIPIQMTNIDSFGTI